MARVAVNASDLRQFSRAMRQVDRRLANDLRKALKDGAEVIAVRARELAYSEGIAGTIKAGAAGASAYVQIGNDKHPEAKLLEVGNASSHRSLLASAASGSFKRPVFPRKDESRDEWTWTTQPTHPCLGPAALEKEGAAVDQLLLGVNRTLKTVRLEME